MKQITRSAAFAHICLLTLTSFFFSVCCAQLTADFTMNRSGGCSPLSIAFTNTSIGTSAQTTYAWSFGNGNSSALQNPSAIYIQEKTYTVTLTITNGATSSTKTKTIVVYKKPVVDFSAAAPKVCLPAPAIFNMAASAGDGNIAAYDWDFGDGFTQQGFGSQMSHYYTNAFIPTISVTVTNSYGCQTSATKSNVVEILPKLDPVFTVNKTMLCTLTDSIQITNNSTGPGPLQYLWNFGDGTTSTAINPIHKYTTKGVYPVTLTLSNAVGCSVTSPAVSVNAAYFQTAFTTQAYCRQIGFTGSAFLYPSSTIWTFGDGATSNNYSGTSHTYATAGTYNVSLINTYGSCKDTLTKAINVQDLINYNSAISAPAAVCKGNNVTLTSTSTQPPTASTWAFGDGSSTPGYSSSVNHSYATPGTYTITLTNTFGTCTETVTKSIVVNDLPNINGFAADFGGVCGAPVTVTFRDTSTGAVTWRWEMDYLGNTPFSTAATATYNFQSNGSHYVYLTVTNAAGCSRTVSKYITISQPNVSIYYTQSSSPRGVYDCDSLNLKFVVNSNQTLQSYSWNLGNGTTSTLANPSVHYSSVGTYNVVLTYVTESGCTGITSFAPAVYNQPAANFTYSAGCNTSLNLRFSDASPFSDQWLWKYSDGGMDYYNFPTHQFADTGHYNVTFINHVGHCADTITKAIYLTVLPSNVNITKADNTCAGTRGTVTFDQRSLRASGGTWNFGDGTTLPYDSSNHFIQHTYAATGTYTVTLNSSYNGCACISSREVKVLLKQTPSLTGSPLQLCTNNTMSVQINNLQLNPFSYSAYYDHYYLTKYEYGNGVAFSGSVSNYNFTPNIYSATLQSFTAGATSLRAIITDYYTNCQDTSNYITIAVNGPLSGFTVSNNNGCYKSPMLFTDTSRSLTATPLTSWFWDFGDGITITNNTNAAVSHRYANAGNYSVRQTVTDATGCSKTSTTQVTAKGPKAAFTTSGLYVPNVPLNTTITFNNNSYSNSGTTNYLWQYGDGTTATTYSGSHTYTVPGVYTVMLIAVDPSIPCSDTAKQVITVKDFNTAFSYTTAFLSANSCPPVVVRINNLSVGYNRVLWDFGDGTSSTQSYPSHTYYNPGLYRIVLYTYGFNGLSGTYRDSVTISAPSAQITADVLKGCTAQNVNLQATTQNSTNYLWDFGDGNLSTTATTAPHPYNTPGIYFPRLIVKDGSGCPASAQLADSIVIDSLKIGIKGIPSIVCDSSLISFQGDIQSFSASMLGTVLTYKWDFGTGIAADTANVRNPAFRYVTPGTYTVKLTVTSPYGCIRTTTATIVVNQKSHGRISSVAEACEQLQVQFTGSASPANGATWSWNFGNGNTSTAQNPPAQVYNPGNYIVTLLLSKNGCVDTTIHQLTIYPKPVVTLTPKQSILCKGSSIALQAGGGISYLWTPAQNLSSSQVAAPVASPQTTTQYTVQVTSNKGCINSDSTMITLAQPIKVSLPSSTDLCKGFTTQLTAGGATTYQWINNIAGLNTTSNPTPMAAPQATTTYTLVGYDAYNCFTDTAFIIVNVHDLPTVNAGPDLQVVGGVAVQLTSTTSNDVVSWNWLPAGTLSCATCAAPMATPKMETAYVVQVKNDFGCEAKDTVLVKLNCAIGNVRIADAFTPNNDGKNDVFYIRGSGVKIIHYLRIYDRWGEIVFERKTFGIDEISSGWDGRRNGQPLPTGTYVYLSEMECSSGELFTLKGTVTLIR